MGDAALIARMAASWKVLSGAIELPENAPAYSRRDAIEIEEMKAGAGA